MQKGIGEDMEMKKLKRNIAATFGRNQNAFYFPKKLPERKANFLLRRIIMMFYVV